MIGPLPVESMRPPPAGGQAPPASGEVDVQTPSRPRTVHQELRIRGKGAANVPVSAAAAVSAAVSAAAVSADVSAAAAVSAAVTGAAAASAAAAVSADAVLLL